MLLLVAFKRCINVKAEQLQILSFLDEIESRIELIRDQAVKIEAEKESLHEMLGTLQQNTDILRLGEGKRSCWRVRFIAEVFLTSSDGTFCVCV